MRLLDRRVKQVIQRYKRLNAVQKRREKEIVESGYFQRKI